MKWYAVIGRIPGDDEDSCYIYHTESGAAAISQFENDIYEDDSDRNRFEVTRHYGAAVFITHVLCSATAISQDC